MIQHRGVTTVEAAADSDEELAFLMAIAQDYSDPVPKLIYADWLEDQGDLRGDLIRESVRADDAGELLPSTDDLPRAWLQMTGLIAVHELQGAHHPRDTTEALLRNARPALAIDTIPASDDEIPVGESKFGGRPDLPEGVPWPTFDRGEHPFFLAQIRLEDLAGTVAGKALPPSGLLLFFFYAEAKVIHIAAGSPLKRASVPASPDSDFDWCYPIPAARVRLAEELHLLDEEAHAREDFDFRERHLIEPRSIDRGDSHYLLGTSFARSMSVVETEPGVRSLARFVGDSDTDLFWGDSGDPTFSISADDLAAGAFERAEGWHS